MKKLSAILATLTLLALPFSAVAMSHGKSEGMKHGSMEKMDHGSKKGMDHGKMMKDKNMIMLGKQTQDGVKGMAHMKDVGKKMAEMGMDATHHFMMMFEDAQKDKAIEEGLVAVKVTTPAGKTRKPVKLMGMEGHFGADVSLKEKGTYKFEVGTKLKDGQKRTYTFDYTVK
ncbi:MAG: hypothetical protein GWO11_07970 [Desulfuromonadales bacterium]|nr:hypothetical protein [Desulfuromonadales bacterium]NIR34249.1 hypothetical protein [Desulfuromonadales bacterium]NIS44236.1 hypothetical protein [Desulfuromonadales bacterium]